MTASTPGGLTPEQRSRNGRLGAHVQWSRCTDRTARTEPARAAFEDRFERQVDPEGVLDAKTRSQMAASARAAFYARLSAAGVKARQARAAKASTS